VLIVRAHAGGGLEVLAFDLRAKAPRDERIDIGGWAAHADDAAAAAAARSRRSRASPR
jgi:alpha-beta hydrolase superfamily lysophospholipase